MKKIDCIEDYFGGTRALYYYFLGEMENIDLFKRFILDDKNITYATVSLISVLMLGIKEELVNNKGERIYESKLFLKSLEKYVNIIAKKEEDGYYLDNYRFNNAAEVVAIIRNKLAHGNFKIDYDNKKIIFNHKNNELNVKIYKLSAFVVSGVIGCLQNEKTNIFSRNFCACTKVENGRTKPLKNINEVKNIFRNTNYYNFLLTTEDEFVPQICIDKVEEYISYYSENLDSKKLYNIYLELEKFLNSFGCTLKIEKKKVYSDNLEKTIIQFADKFLINNINLTYEDQVNVITTEVLKNMNTEYTTFDPVFSNVKLLVILDAIRRTNSIERNVISHYLSEQGYNEIYFNYDVLGAILINMFNTLYMHGFDDIYTTSGGYKLNRDNEFDFALLDFSNINPVIDGIDYTPLNVAKARFDKQKKECDALSYNLEKSIENYNNTTDESAKDRIYNLMNNINSQMIEKKTIMEVEKENYLRIAKDYVENAKYFKNKAIINGIRNSIAHGHYKIISGDHIASTKIIFTDLYEGKETFKVELTYKDFSEMIECNCPLIFIYLENKKSKEFENDNISEIRSLKKETNKHVNE